MKIRLRIAPGNLEHGSRIYLQKDAEPEIDISGLVRSVSWEHAAGELPVYKLELIDPGVGPTFAVELQDLSGHSDSEHVFVKKVRNDDGELIDVTTMIDRYSRKARP